MALNAILILWKWSSALQIEKENNGAYSAFTLQCTHASNPLILSGDKFLCSLHGSTFDQEGKVIHGPAVRPLEHLKTRLTPECIMITLSDWYSWIHLYHSHFFISHEMTIHDMFIPHKGNFHATKILRTLLHRVLSSNRRYLNFYRDFNGTRGVVSGHDDNERTPSWQETKQYRFTQFPKAAVCWLWKCRKEKERAN